MVLQWAQENFNKDIFTSPPARAKLIPLKVSAPFHCSMMKPAEERMSEVLHDIPFDHADWTIIQNFTAQGTTDPDLLRSHLIAQISGAVRWIESVELAKEKKCRTFIEYGTGRVLSGLLKKIDSELQVYSTNSLEDLKLIESEMKGAL